MLQRSNRRYCTKTACGCTHHLCRHYAKKPAPKKGWSACRKTILLCRRQWKSFWSSFFQKARGCPEGNALWSRTAVREAQRQQITSAGSAPLCPWAQKMLFRQAETSPQKGLVFFYPITVTARSYTTCSTTGTAMLRVFTKLQLKRMLSRMTLTNPKLVNAITKIPL